MNCLLIFLPSIFPMSQPDEQKIKVSYSYINLPVNQDKDRAEMTLRFEDGTKGNFVIQISEEELGYWVFVGLSAFQWLP